MDHAGSTVAAILFSLVVSATPSFAQESAEGATSAEEGTRIEALRERRADDEASGDRAGAKEREQASKDEVVDRLRREIEERSREGITRADLQLARGLYGSLFCPSCEIVQGRIGVEIRLISVDIPEGRTDRVDRYRRRLSPEAGSGRDSPAFCTDKLGYDDWRMRDVRVELTGRGDGSVAAEIEDQSIGLPFRGCLMVRLRDKDWSDLLDEGERLTARYRLIRYDRRHGKPPHWSRDTLEVAARLTDGGEVGRDVAEEIERRLEGMSESRQLWRCWEEHLPRVRATAATLAFQVELGDRGEVQKVRGPEDAAPRLRGVASCAADVARSMAWPAPGRADASVTFELAIRTYRHVSLLP